MPASGPADRPGRRYDLAVVGSGPGGCAAALTAARRGLRVGLIERGRWGGVCLNVGCIPTKALVTVAQQLRALRRAGALGIAVEGHTLDYAAVRSRSARIVETLRRGLIELLRRERVELLAGEAGFMDPHRLELTTETGIDIVEADRVVLATGAAPLAGPWALDEDRCLSYQGLLALEALPRSLLIIGGGVIGCEFASLLSAFGTRVTIIEQAARLLPAEDADAARWLARRLEAEGAALVCGMTVERLERTPEGVRARLTDGSERRAERCLVAIGQQPNLGPLRLAAASVTAARGITVDRFLRTAQPHIAAIGDCLEGHGLAHWASAEGALAVNNLLGDPQESLEATDVPRCVFTDPEIAHVGLSGSEDGRPCRMSRLSFGALGKAHCDDATEGFVKVLADPATDRVLGATIVGAHASSLIQGAVLAMQHGLTARELARTITTHPTLAEGLTEAAAALYGESLVVASRRPAEAGRGATG